MKIGLLHSRKWSAILIALIIMTLLSVVIITFLEKSLWLGKNVKSIEQSTQAYYVATTGIERALANTTNLKKQPWKLSGTILDSASISLYNSDNSQPWKSYTGITMNAYWESSIIPFQNEWNSPFHKNYNLLTLNSPMQIPLPAGITEMKISFRIPDVTSGNINAGTISNWQNGLCKGECLKKTAIFWSLWNGKDILYGSGSISGWDKKWTITINDIKNFLDNNSSSSYDIKLTERTGYAFDSKWDHSEQTFKVFYDSNCKNNYDCILKLTLVSSIPAQSSNWKNRQLLPFIEYQVSSNNDLPLPFTRLRAMGRVDSFARGRSVDVPYFTSNTALDFTVIQ